jgi:hypothetical protein
VHSLSSALPGSIDLNDAVGSSLCTYAGCAAVPDFTTPEYTTFNSIQPYSWESNEGMDPFSYGINSATNASQYKNGTTIIQTLVDIVSKNGNLLVLFNAATFFSFLGLELTRTRALRMTWTAYLTLDLLRKERL